jgi:hypothetical protein
VTPRPDSQSFTRLLISAGAFFLVAAFVVPGLVLRDTGVLTISRNELAESTPTAAKELKRRQEVATDAGKAAPYAGLIFLVVGGVLIALGVPRLWRQEQSDEERREMELDKLRAELRPQSPEERRERLREDIDGGETAEEGLTSKEPPEALMREAAGAEEAVLSRLTKISPPLYDLRSQVVVDDAGGRLPMDGLLISKIDQLPDIVVEIKYLRRGIVEWERRIREGRWQLQVALERYERPSLGWLIVVTAEALDHGRQERVEKMFPEPGDGVRLSIVTRDQLDQLSLPG